MNTIIEKPVSRTLAVKGLKIATLTKTKAYGTIHEWRGEMDDGYVILKWSQGVFYFGASSRELIAEIDIAPIAEAAWPDVIAIAKSLEWTVTSLVNYLD